MAAFHSMSSGATSGDGMTLNSAVVDGIDASLFDDSLLDPANGTFPTMSFTPTYDFQDFSATGFEDPFAYSNRQYEVQLAPEEFSQDSTTQELDSKLLGFSAPLLKAAVVDGTGQHVEANMSAELYGMFFVAEDVFGAENSGRPLELTCYRRNLWQCSGQITLPRHITHIVDEQGRQIPIFELAASITAVESIEGKATEIISIPWKSAHPIGAEEPKSTGGPPTIVLDLENGQEVDANRVSLPLSWKRLQFKHATANNGRRKGLQQHYLVQINLLGKQQTGEYVKIAEVHSGPVIVRGRSPRNFDSRKDIPLTGGDKKLGGRSNSDASATTVKESSNSSVPTPVLKYQQPQGSAQQPADWAPPQMYQDPGRGPPPSKKVAMSPGINRPPIPAWSSETSRPLARASTSSSAPRAGVSGPINLSLSEDERSPNRSNSDVQSPQFSKSTAAAGHHLSQSPKEEDDLLYEYFPLSVDDWMPPVEAIYRPHVVHHTIVPPEIKAQQLRSKAKRYFTAES
ncbi:Putative p53-like transcription factor, DNA-binding domain superfamily, NDT80 DNA-binding protein [Colletotrichum destructivum]|uniref:P53-like transcription factor, DNA-binding domain superfamily, NDT80 DNA-binding protein n=1 Tax=Colletotrichum destructivum TaxID=34406 RepID=A0AAX4IL84_9PEZI|nr:Putative p53-like transcription factor, DNA-binding domain superfamily, NDT80 DNA-binding protein [Colletotrichum destructivum]